MKATHGPLVEAWYAGAVWLYLLRPLEFLFRGIAAGRRWAYRVAILPRFRADVPVVIVGNITVGGTGKTPVVIALVEALQEQGLRVGVVGRGYGATAKEFPYKVSEHSTVAECGDEALIIYQRTQCPCVVAPSRVAAVQVLLDTEDVDLVICDDGLQHYALERDLEIVMYDARSGFGNGFCLPAGPLREPLSRLSQVDFVLGRGLGEPKSSVKYCVEALVNVADDSQLEASPESIGNDVYAVAGVGRPEMFFESLRECGFSIEERIFADHHQFVAADFNRLTDHSNKPIIMTEKDAVKCRHLAGDNAWYLKISAVIPAEVVTAAVGLLKK